MIQSRAGVGGDQIMKLILFPCNTIICIHEMAGHKMITPLIVNAWDFPCYMSDSTLLA